MPPYQGSVAAPKYINAYTELMNLILDTTWDDTATLGLLEMYKARKEKLANPNTKKRSIWKEIMKGLAKRGYYFTYREVERRWETLASAYQKAVIERKKTSDNTVTSPFFEEIENIFSSNGSDVEDPSSSDIKGGFSFLFRTKLFLFISKHYLLL